MTENRKTSEVPAGAEMSIRWNDPLAVEVTAAVQRGQADRLRRLLDKHPGLARARIVKDGESAGSRTLLHLFADWPGHRRNPHEIVAVLVAAGADPDAPGLPGDVSAETPLHWAGSDGTTKPHSTQPGPRTPSIWPPGWNPAAPAQPRTSRD